MTNVTGFFNEQQWEFAPHERSPLPGAPATPKHPAARRVVYGLIGCLVGLTAGTGTALISANQPYLQGSLGLYQNEIAWLPAAYVMTNVPAGMVLIKYRQQFGLRSFLLIFQALYCVLCLAHLIVGGFESALLVRAASGIAGSALTTMGLNYLTQAFPAAQRLAGISIGISVPQIAIPMARIFSSDLLSFEQLHTLYLFEFGLAILSFAAIAVVRLPSSIREKAFEWLDLPTVVLFTSGIILVCSVLAVGRFAWWTDTAWLGWALAASIPLFAAVFLIEFNRANPIIDFRWMGTSYSLRFVLIGAVARIVLSEQTYGSVGFLQSLGLTNDQLVEFAVLTTLASAGGVIAGGIAVGPARLTQVVACAIGLVAVAAYWDSFSTSLTRAPQLYFTAMVISFSTTLYVGPAILIGFTKVLAQGGKKLTSFIVLFGTTQSLGGLVGTALLSTYQSYREKQHSFDITQHLAATDSVVAQTMQQAGGTLSQILTDPGQQAAQGIAALTQRVTIEANVLAYDDVFRLVAILAVITAGLLLVFVLYQRRLSHSMNVGSPIATQSSLRS